MKKFIMIGVLSSLLIALIFAGIWVKKTSGLLGDTIEEAIQRYSGEHELIEGIIEKVPIGKKKILVFMFNENKSYACYSLVQKLWFDKWRVEKQSSTPAFRHPAETYPYSYSLIASEQVNGYWGVIFDSRIETIVLKHNNQEEFATVIDAPDSKSIWYKVFPIPEEKSENISIWKAIDSDGNEVPWSELD